MRVASDKLSHIAAAPPCAGGFARSLRETPKRFHSIIIGDFPERRFCGPEAEGAAKRRSVISEPVCAAHLACRSFFSLQLILPFDKAPSVTMLGHSTIYGQDA